MLKSVISIGLLATATAQSTGAISSEQCARSDNNGDGYVGVDDVLGVLSYFKLDCDGARVELAGATGSDMCADRADVMVATAFCASAGSPPEATEQLCNDMTADEATILNICTVEGVAGTGRLLCNNLGYSADTCDQVAAIADAAFGVGGDVYNGFQAALPGGVSVEVALQAAGKDIAAIGLGCALASYVAPGATAPMAQLVCPSVSCHALSSH